MKQWLKIPREQRRELRAAYKQAGYSYMEAVKDFETELPKMRQGGQLPYQTWEQNTGLPWSEARNRGLTTGSAQDNLALQKSIQSGQFNIDEYSVPANTSDLDNLPFNKAFSQARQRLGGNQIFNWRGQQYTTDLSEENSVINNEIVPKENNSASVITNRGYSDNYPQDPTPNRTTSTTISNKNPWKVAFNDIASTPTEDTNNIWANAQEARSMPGSISRKIAKKDVVEEVDKVVENIRHIPNFREYSQKYVDIKEQATPEYTEQVQVDLLEKDDDSSWWNGVGTFINNSRDALKAMDTNINSKKLELQLGLYNNIIVPIENTINQYTEFSNKPNKEILVDIANNLDPESKQAKILKYMSEAPFINSYQFTPNIGSVVNNVVAMIGDTKYLAEGYRLSKARDGDTSTAAQINHDKLLTQYSNKSNNTANNWNYVPKNNEPLVWGNQSQSNENFPDPSKLMTTQVHVNPYNNERSTSFILDMSQGVRVTYAPRNENKSNRTDVPNGVAIVEALYDHDFTDGYKHSHAQNRINRIQESWQSGEGIPYTMVRLPIQGVENEYIKKIIPTSELTQEHFDNDLVYAADYSVLPAQDISDNLSSSREDRIIRTRNNNGKIEAYFTRSAFQTRGVLTDGVRLVGPQNSIESWQPIGNINHYGPYNGGTVTLVTNDGKTVETIAGSVALIMKRALTLRDEYKQDVVMLSNDMGSMSHKPWKGTNGITKNDLDYVGARNPEGHVAAQEILLRP